MPKRGNLRDTKRSYNKVGQKRESQGEEGQAMT